jgi:ComF family protein
MSIIHHILDFIFPRNCAGCYKSLVSNENYICTDCLFHLPKTGYWKDTNNPAAQLFWGKVKIENTASHFFFQKKSRVQNIFHHLKYKDMKELGEMLGKLFGEELHQTPYASADVIVPVPLHKNRMKKRGYNQSEWIAAGLSAALSVPVDTTSVIRTSANETQTSKGRYARWKNVENIFSVAKCQTLEGKHIILVDDILTTGATLEACATAILEVPGTRVSILTLAKAEK